MKFIGIAFFLLAAATISFAQLLPQKAEADVPKFDRAMVFKVDYDAKAAASDSSSKRIDASIKENREKGNYIKNALIWTGLCITGGALSAAFDSHQMIDCRTK